MQKNNSIFFHYAKLRDLEIAFSLIFQFCNTKVSKGDTVVLY